MLNLIPLRPPNIRRQLVLHQIYQLQIILSIQQSLPLKMKIIRTNYTVTEKLETEKHQENLIRTGKEATLIAIWTAWNFLK